MKSYEESNQDSIDTAMFITGATILGVMRAYRPELYEYPMSGDALTVLTPFG